VKVLSHLDHVTQSQVLELIEVTRSHDGIPPLADHVLLHLRHGGDRADTHIIHTISINSPEDTIVGYAHLDTTDEVEGPSAELVIHPDYRHRGYGKKLLERVKELAGKRLRLWSHGDLPGAKNLAINNGFHRVRNVIQMQRPLNDDIPLPNPKTTIRSFLLDIDNDEWLSLNNRIFAGHPEQGRWTNNDLAIRTHEAWFDEQGFLLAIDQSKIIGFCWTKIHGGHTHSHGESKDHHDHEPIGEIYIMGIDPSYFGRGIGKDIALAGLHHLRYQGLNSVLLYVDETNSSAINLYTSIGFTESGRDVLYRTA
jgi:mycothiol synthase